MASQQPPLPSFNKQWLSYQDQVALLQQRGLVVADPATGATLTEAHYEEPRHVPNTRPRSDPAHTHP